MTNDRKSDHIRLAFDSQTGLPEQDRRFIYEPMLAAHPEAREEAFPFLGKTMRAPVWVSSMTGGTGVAKTINANIARVCHSFGLGMGLGSCRKIVSDKTHWDDFDFRDVIGPDLPFYANLGIAQVEELLTSNQVHLAEKLVNELRADGLIIHVNPLQEWFQPEGNRLKRAPLDTISEFIHRTDLRVVVKEVGQGFGPESLRQLLLLPLEAVEFGAYGGTNFSKLEMMRNDPVRMEALQPFAFVGQSALQMIRSVNRMTSEGFQPRCRQLIISGGIKTTLDGYYLRSISPLPAVLGMASQVLKYAAQSYELLHLFMESQLQALQLAETYLTVNPDYEG